MKPFELPSIRRYSDESSEWLSEMPRHLLGSMACDFNLLVSIDAEATYMNSTGLSAHYLEAAFESNTRSILTELLTAEGRDDGVDAHIYVRAKAESFVWRALTGRKNRDLTSLHTPYIDAMNLMIEVSGSKPYVEAGIIDSELIRSCIDNGVDVETAMALNSVRKASSLGAATT